MTVVPLTIERALNIVNPLPDSTETESEEPLSGIMGAS